MAILRVQVTTNTCSDTEVYQHELPEDADKYEIIQAINTLYGSEGVTRIDMELVEE